MAKQPRKPRRAKEKPIVAVSRDDKGRFVAAHNEGGAPEKPIDWETVNKLIGLGCIGEEISGFIKVGYSTLYRRCKELYDVPFDEYIKSNKAGYRVSLRRAQYISAIGEKTTVKKTRVWIDEEKGEVREVTEREVYLTPPNITMQIWLGKNELEQSDKQEVVERQVHSEIDWEKVPISERRRIIELMENARRE